jgi:hypothetical protein
MAGEGQGVQEMPVVEADVAVINDSGFKIYENVGVGTGLVFL